MPRQLSTTPNSKNSLTTISKGIRPHKQKWAHLEDGCRILTHESKVYMSMS